MRKIASASHSLVTWTPPIWIATRSCTSAATSSGTKKIRTMVSVFGKFISLTNYNAMRVRQRVPILVGRTSWSARVPPDPLFAQPNQPQGIRKKPTGGSAVDPGGPPYYERRTVGKVSGLLLRRRVFRRRVLFFPARHILHDHRDSAIRWALRVLRMPQLPVGVTAYLRYLMRTQSISFHQPSRRVGAVGRKLPIAIGGVAAIRLGISMSFYQHIVWKLAQ